MSYNKPCLASAFDPTMPTIEVQRDFLFGAEAQFLEDKIINLRPHFHSPTLLNLSY